MNTITTELETTRGTISLVEFIGAGLPRAVVIVLSGAAERDDQTADAVRRIAEAGFEVVAVDVSALTGGGADDTAQSGDVRDEDLMSAVDALLQHVAGRQWSLDQVGIVGFGLGGRAALVAAARDAIGAVVSWSAAGIVHPVSVGLPALLESIEAVISPWLGMFGDADVAAPAEDIKAFGGTLNARSRVFCDVVVYPGATHDFYRADGNPSNQDALFDGWQRTIEWFERRLAPRPTPFGESWLKLHHDVEELSNVEATGDIVPTEKEAS